VFVVKNKKLGDFVFWSMFWMWMDGTMGLEIC